MGAVCLAERDSDFKQTVAIKIIDQVGPSPKSIDRFRQEREILSRLQHNNIARLFDGGFDPKVGLYFVMEYVDGLPIDVYCRKHEVGLRKRLELFCEVCDAVSYAHRNLVIHRDLKPRNILIRSDGVVKLLDFGIAKCIDELPDQLTVTGHPMTPAYASPEQKSGTPVTTATDVYSLGVVLFELMTERRPWDMLTDGPVVPDNSNLEVPPYPSEVARTSASQNPIDYRSLRGDLDRLVLKALSINPARRYQSTDAFRDDVWNYLEDRPISAKSRRIGYVARKFVSRNRHSVFVMVVGLIIVATVLGLWVKTTNQYRAEKASTQGLSTFLVDLFEIADPSLRPDTAIMAVDLLNVGRTHATSLLAGNRTQYAEFMSLIGNLYNKVGEYERAVGVHKQAIRVLPATMSEERIENMLGLGRSYFELGRFEAADSILDRTLREQISLKGRFDRRTADILSAMSELALETDKLDVADSLVTVAMTIRQAKKIDDPSGLAELVYRQGIISRMKGKPERSVQLLNQALVLFDRDETASPLKVAAVHNSLGLAYSDLLSASKTIESFEKALAILRHRLGGFHPRVGIVLANMSISMERLGMVDSSDDLIREALSILRYSRGNKHPDVAWALHALGVSMMARMEVAKAESLYHAAAEIGKRSFAPTHRLMAGIKHDLAIAQRTRGDLDAALISYTEAVRVYEQTGEKDDARRSDALNGLGKVQRDLGLLQQAIASFRECLEIRQRVLEPDHWKLGTAHSLLGETLAMAGQRAEARLHLEKGVRILEATRGADDIKTIQARQRLTSLESSQQVVSADHIGTTP
jgi:serine/threonine-protein kinase